MKLNKKGFAISSIMYLILVLALLLVSITLMVLSNRRIVLDKLKKEVVVSIEGTPLESLTVVFDDGNVGNYTFVVPQNGMYKIELWGAQGAGTTGGKGAYTSGIIELNKGEILYVYIGGKGNTFNGGGNSSDSSRKGGGATDIRLVDGNWDDFSSLKSRIMVAAGGGSVSSEANNAKAGIGGTLNGIDGNPYEGAVPIDFTGKGGTQTSGGSGATNESQNPVATNGQFGIGGTAGAYSNDGHVGSGGGGGYYGGGGSSWHAGSGGGSSYISGYIGCNSISLSSTSSSITHTESPVHNSGKVFSNPVMIAGDTLMTEPNGSTSTGHSGDGYARITFIAQTDYSQTEFTYGYLNEEQIFTTPKSGYYKLEVWGAQGGSPNNDNYGGYGGYSKGYTHLNAKTKLYINVGGQGESCTEGGSCIANGGYNGGGNSKSYSGSGSSAAGGGGATHIATSSGILSSLSSNESSILIVAGGGGGGNYTNGSNFGKGGAGGGAQGGSSLDYGSGSYGGDSLSNAFGTGGTQLTGGCRYNNSNNCGTFGQGYSDTSASNGAANSGGGGGGYYGGGGTYVNAGGGGSGYIGNSKLLGKYMVCYNCQVNLNYDLFTFNNTRSESSATSTCPKKENGYAKITYLDSSEYYVNSTPKTFNNGEYIDTNFKIDWDKDFVIETLVNIPTLGLRYIIFGSYNGSSTQELNVEINASNKLRVYFGKGQVDSTSSSTIVAGEDIKITFYWDSTNKQFTATAKGIQTDASVAGSYSMSGKTSNGIRVGACDFRGSCGTFKSLTLKSINIFNN